MVFARRRGYRLSYLSGRWAAETQLNREPIHEGIKVLESRTGHTGHNINPWFAIDQGDADENARPRMVRRVGLERKLAHQRGADTLSPGAGHGRIQSVRFRVQAGNGRILETPVFYAGYSQHGFGEASRLLHNLERTDIEPGGIKARPRPVLYNSWEATEFKVDEAGQTALAEKAAKLGRGIVRDGRWLVWQTKQRSRGTGRLDGESRKIPEWLEGLITKVNALGMDFGCG